MPFTEVVSKKYDETITINFIGTEKLDSSLLSGTTSRIHLRLSQPISGVTKITSFTDDVDGTINQYQYLRKYFKYKNNHEESSEPCDECGWSKMIPFDGLSGRTNGSAGISGITFNPNVPLDLQIFYFRVDEPQVSPTSIYVSNIVLSGEYDIEESDEPFIINSAHPSVILKPKDIYKVFSIDDFQVISRGDMLNIDIKYRVTQDNGRTYSNWEPLTTANISTYRFNELRFAQVEYLVSQISPASDSVKIYDIMLIGDFQNISADYLKTNRYGLKADCLARYLQETGQAGKGCLKGYTNAGANGTGGDGSNPIDYGKNFYTQGLSCYMSEGNLSISDVTSYNDANSAGYWNPYETSKITEYYNMLANQVNDILGWEIDYHRVQEDANGIDMVLHEYQLYNIIAVKKLKVIVPDNKFPDNQVVFNTFNLDLFDTFEIQIMKDEFKNKFGIEQRPGQNDILYFCQINRLFYVKHAQIFRDVMNAGVYYKVILEKYEQKANINNLSTESANQLAALTKDTTLDELFGIEVQQEMDKIANKDQTYPLTFEKMRQSFHTKVLFVNDPIRQNGTEVAQGYYDFHKCVNVTAVTYSKIDKVLKESDNRSFICWFAFNDKFRDEVYKEEKYKAYHVNRRSNFFFLNNYDDTYKLGYNFWYHNGEIVFQINDQYFRMGGLQPLTNIWYQLVINLDQRQRLLDIYLYKRNIPYKVVMMRDNKELASVLSTNTTGYTYLVDMNYRPVTNLEESSETYDYQLIANQTFEFYPFNYVHSINPHIMSSDIKYTNLRVFNDVIPSDSIGNILNQLIVTDAQHLILADNAYRKLYTRETYENQNMWD